jgi:hypothetical protein
MIDGDNPHLFRRALKISGNQKNTAPGRGKDATQKRHFPGKRKGLRRRMVYFQLLEIFVPLLFHVRTLYPCGNYERAVSIQTAFKALYNFFSSVSTAKPVTVGGITTGQRCSSPAQQCLRAAGIERARPPMPPDIMCMIPVPVSRIKSAHRGNAFFCGEAPVMVVKPILMQP